MPKPRIWQIPWILQVSELTAGVVLTIVIWLLTDREHNPNTLIEPAILGILIALAFEQFRTHHWLEEQVKEAQSQIEEKFKDSHFQIEEKFRKVDTLDARSSEMFLRLARGAGEVKAIAKA
jgi:hypothetical protein